MSRKTSIPKVKVKPQMVIKETFYRTKRFFHKTFTNLKSFVSKGYQKLPKAPTPDPIFSCTSKIKINSKLQELDNFYRGFCDHWDSVQEKVKTRDGYLQTKADEKCSKSSMSIADCSGSEGIKEDDEARNNILGRRRRRKPGTSSYLSQKMKELEMLMDVKDMDHVLDVEEILHYYSRLTCPAYVEIVDKFFMDVYSELNMTEKSRSVLSSMASLDPPLKL